MQPEPATFDLEVRQAGLEWLQKRQLNPDAPKPRGLTLEATWQSHSLILYQAYGGVCAYYGYRFPFSSGANTTDHFIPSSQNLRLAYEWSNYRLACLGANRNKLTNTVFDPFELENNWLRLDFITLKLEVSNDCPSRHFTLLTFTISEDGLDLNSASLVDDRQKKWEDYLGNEITGNILLRDFPFLYHQAALQNRLRP